MHNLNPFGADALKRETENSQIRLKYVVHAHVMVRVTKTNKARGRECSCKWSHGEMTFEQVMFEGGTRGEHARC
jgi:hypothetical protein